MKINPLDNAFAYNGMQKGLTKREYFAAMAMQGLVRMDLSISESKIAELSVMQADALIKQLNKQQEK